MTRRTKQWIIMAALAALMAVLLLFGAPAFANHMREKNCAPRALIIQRLMGQFGEVPQNIHMPYGRAAVELWVNRNTGTWTLVKNRIGGRSCIVADGKGEPPLDKGA